MNLYVVSEVLYEQRVKEIKWPASKPSIIGP